MVLYMGELTQPVDFGKIKARCLPVKTVGGWSLLGGNFLSLPPLRREVIHMVTYEELFAYTLVILGVIDVVIQLTKKK